MNEEQKKEVAIRGDEWASTKTADRGSYYFAGLSEGYYNGYLDGAEFGYNKANEWHFVKDELPPIKKEYCGRSELVLVVSKEKEMQYAQYVEKEKTWARGICEISFVPYAWKEIVLPKEIE